MYPGMAVGATPAKLHEIHNIYPLLHYPGMAVGATPAKLHEIHNLYPLLHYPGMAVGATPAKLHEIQIYGMSCQRCVDAITQSLKELPLQIFEIRSVVMPTTTENF